MASVHCYQGRRHATCPVCGKLVIGRNRTGRWTVENVVTGGVQHKKCYFGGLTQKQYLDKLRNS